MHLGNSKLPFSILFFLLVLLSAKALDTKNINYRLNASAQIDNYIDEKGSLIINYSIPEISFIDTTNDYGNFFRLTIPGHTHTTEPGDPELPVYSRLITLPESEGFKIKITDVRFERINPPSRKIGGQVWPAQESNVKRELRDKPPFRLNRETYSRKNVITSDTVSIIPEGKMRNIKLANLVVSPVHYNPGKNSVEIIKSMKIEITFNNPLSEVKSWSTESAMFNQSLSKGIIDLTGELVTGYTDKPIGMIILTDTSYKNQLKPFIQWKTQKGFNVRTIYRGKNLGGESYTEIRNTLKNIYDSATESNPAPYYLLIVGDVNKIPYYGEGTSGNITDMYYGEFDGSGDYIPEMYVGRLPARDTGEVRTVVNKIVQYEKFGFGTLNSFYSTALATTGYDPDHTKYMNGQVKYAVENYFTTSNNIVERHFYHYSDANFQQKYQQRKDSIISLLNKKGISFINYSGHGEPSGWLLTSEVKFNIRDTGTLHNRNMYPLIVSNACQTAKFSESASFGNRMVLEKNRGAIAFIGCSNDSYWDEDYFWAVGLGKITDNPVFGDKGPGIYDRLFHTHDELPSNWFYTLGQINYAGNLSVSSGTSLRKKYYWETYNVIGDPSLIPIIGKPQPFSFSIPDTLPNGIRSFSIQTEPFCYIAISHSGTLLDASFSGKSGFVTLHLPLISNDSCLVVVTGQNRFPIIKTVHFSDIHKEYLNLSSFSVNDIAGNQNSKADFNETLFLSVRLDNLGLSDASDVYIKLQSPSEWISIETDSVYLGSLSHEAGIVVPDQLKLKVSSNVPDNGIASIILTAGSSITKKQYSIDISLHAPQLQITACKIDDSLEGNGDSFADPDETFYLVFRVLNTGSSDADGALKITNLGGGITILDTEPLTGLVKTNDYTDFRVHARLSDYVLSGESFSLNSIFECYPFTVNNSFSIRSGKIRESFESKSFDVLPWINNISVPWIISETNQIDGLVSARSGYTPNLSNSRLLIKTYYPSNDTLKFSYNVASETGYDYFSFSINNHEIVRDSGEKPWERVAIPVKAGYNIFEWKYSKDKSVSVSTDCVSIDMIDFSVSGSVKFIRRDLQIARIIPIEKNPIGKGTLTLMILNQGKDTINGFNLAYSLDNMIPVREFFKIRLLPNSVDSSTVTFTKKVDLSRYGIFNLTAYAYGNNDDYLGNDTLSIKIENTTINESLVVFPNPFPGRFTVFLNSFYDDEIELTITSMTGSCVYKIQKEILKGGNTIYINDADLAPSMYYLNIKGEKINRTVPLIRLHE
jgi:hypothetical protein